MQIHGYSQLTLLDYPGKLACTVFCGSCNFRCPFCHNASLVLHPNDQPTISEDKILEHLAKRKTMLEGVCVTGGEPTLYPDLPDFLRKLRATGFMIKLDTNGTNPEMLKHILEEKLIDAIAMDIKASPRNYAKATGLNELSMGLLFDSVDIIMNSGLEYEFRTTVVDGLHDEDDFIKISEWIEGARAYYLQRYKDSGDLISPTGLSSPSITKMERYRSLVLPLVPNTYLRGTD